MSNARKANRLVLSQYNALHAWMLNNSDLLRSGKFTKRELAQKASDALGFPVSVSNLEYAAKSFNLRIIPIGSPNGTLSNYTVKHHRNRLLARELIRIETALDMDVPDYLYRIAEWPVPQTAKVTNSEDNK